MQQSTSMLSVKPESQTGGKWVLALFSGKGSTLMLFAGLLLLNLIQAIFTGLFHDEAYYRIYSLDPAVGYFDHPPMVGWLIAAGRFIAGEGNELAIRLLFVFMNLATLILLRELMKPTSLKTYAIVVGSMFMLHVGGFLATPDIPLLFFSTLFVLAFRHWMQRDTFVNALLLALSASLVMYSKYHGAFLMLFMFAANLRLFARKSLYWLVPLSLLLFAPHIWWQYAHDWATFKYHFFERSAKTYHINFTLEYLLAQPFFLAGLNGFLLLWAAWRCKASDGFGRAMKLAFWGIMGFFLLMSLKGKTETHWTAIALIPLAILSSSYFAVASRKFVRTASVLAAVSFGVYLLMRVYILFPELPAVGKFRPESHRAAQWAADIKQHSGNLPVVFMNSYQNAAKYNFYTGIPTHSLNNIHGRRSQYNLGNFEEGMQGKKVFFIFNWDKPGTDSLMAGGIKYRYILIDDFRSWGYLWFVPEQRTIECRAGEVLSFPVRAVFSHPPDTSAHTVFQPVVSLQLFGNGIKTVDNATRIAIDSKLFEQALFHLEFRAPDEPGTYSMRISVRSAPFIPPSINSDIIKVKVGGKARG